ncbi:monocarboxylate transporter 13-like [Patiria miniata]|uniref:Major facilitator superfamily (MFS) profile domain-containing protein n=1 Tax=Patiria miniata TaxID=46514 RepID=A0A913ZU48_PATMI|nr:monocarboxylate transporter 13-like [Patiria miniata]
MTEFVRRFGRHRRRKSPARNSSGRSEWHGWGIVVVLAAHLSIALLDGLLRGIGVFFLSWRDDFDSSAQATAAVSSILTSVYSFSVLLGGVMTKHCGCRTTGIFGGMLTSVGIFSSHWVKEIYQLYIAAAVLGVGQGVAFNAVTVAVAMHFKSQFKTAYAVAYAGGGVGGIAIPPLLQLLLEAYGWRGAMLVISAIAANLIGLSALCRPPRSERCLHAANTLEVQMRSSFDESVADGSNMRSEDHSVSDADFPEVGESGGERPANSTTDDFTEIDSIKTGSKSVKLTHPLRGFASAVGLDLFVKSYRFTLVCLSTIELGFASYGCSQFIIPRAESTGVAPSSTALLLSMYGVGLLVGRLGNGLLIVCRMSAETASGFCLSMAGVSLLLMNVDSYVSMALATFTQGLTSGAIYTIFIVQIRHYVGLEHFGVAVGLNCIFNGIGGLCGPLISGLLYDVTGSYKTIFYLLAGVYFAGALQTLFFPLLKRLEPGVENTEHR